MKVIKATEINKNKLIKKLIKKKNTLKDQYHFALIRNEIQHQT